MSEETEILQDIVLIDPTEAEAMACNVLVNAEGRSSMVMHRQAVLILGSASGRQHVIPMSATGAAQVARDLQVAAAEAANALDDEELEEMEITFSKAKE